MPNKREIERVMDQTGMGELQAYRHVKAREYIKRNRLERTARNWEK